MWPGQMRRPTDRNPNVQAGNLAYAALQQLSPQNEMQKNLNPRQQRGRGRGSDSIIAGSPVGPLCLAGRC